MKFDAIGTEWSIETTTPLNESLQKDILTRVELFDKTYSRFRDDSLVSEVAHTAGRYAFPDDGRKLIQFYKKLHDASDGAVTPLVGDTLEALGYDKTYSLIAGEKKQVKEWNKVMRWNDTVVTTTQSLTLDFGAAGKGYLVDIIGELLEAKGQDAYVIDASGDVRVRGRAEQVIGLEDPNNPERVVGVAKVANASLCASATNRRRWGKDLHHIIDGRTGTSTEDVTATWVIADATMDADGIATALFFCAPDSLRTLGSFEFVRMYSDGKIEHSDGFMGELFI